MKRITRLTIIFLAIFLIYFQINLGYTYAEESNHIFNTKSAELMNFNIAPVSLPSNGHYVVHYEYFTEYLLTAGIDFGNNTDGSCVAVAGGIAMQYFDYSWDTKIMPETIPQSWTDECNAAGNIISSTPGAPPYDVTIPTGSTINEALHRYIIGLSDDDAFGISNYQLAIALMEYNINTACFTYTADVYDDYDYSEGELANIIKDYIDNDKPIVIFLEDIPHAVVVFGYYLNTFYFHTGWNGGSYPSIGSCTHDDLEYLIPLDINIHHNWVLFRTYYRCSHCGKINHGPIIVPQIIIRT